VALTAMERIKQDYPQGVSNRDIRALDEPLLGAGQ